jgi:L-methionine (R)-S-oxide reductase
MSPKEERYQRVYENIISLIGDVNDPITRMATIAAVLHHKIKQYSWSGFYLLKGDDLLLGPFQGEAACVKLPKDKGVCWTSINQQKVINVPDVNEFPGYITCHSETKSELVIPVMDFDNKIFGVMDMDSRTANGFDETDEKELTKIATIVFAQLK